MADKLWSKGRESNRDVEAYTVGADRAMDARLAAADMLGSLAHTRMLHAIGLLGDGELADVQRELKAIYRDVQNGKFAIREGVEDIHSQVELLLTERLGDTGRKIHSGRSRNDQVLVDLRIFLRSEIRAIVGQVRALFDLLQRLSEQHKDVLPRAWSTICSCCSRRGRYATATRLARPPATDRRSRSTGR